MFNALHALVWVIVWIDLIGGLAAICVLSELDLDECSMPGWWYARRLGVRWIPLVTVLLWPIAFPVVLVINVTHAYGTKR